MLAPLVEALSTPTRPRRRSPEIRLSESLLGRTRDAGPYR